MVKKISMINFLSLIALLTQVYAKRVVSLNAKQILSKSLSVQSIAINDFENWFSDPKRPLQIIRLNPGLKKVEILEDDNNNNNKSNIICRGYLKPIQFPGLAITSTVDFQTYFNGTSLSIRCEEGSVKQSFEGNKFLAKIVSALVPNVESENTIFIDKETNSICNKASLQIKFSLPSWFPINEDAVRNGGSDSLQKSMNSDLDGLLDSILNLYILDSKKLNKI